MAKIGPYPIEQDQSQYPSLGTRMGDGMSYNQIIQIVEHVLSQTNHLSLRLVNELPAIEEASDNYVYMVPNPTPTEDCHFVSYVLVGDTYEPIATDVSSNPMVPLTGEELDLIMAHALEEIPEEKFLCGVGFQHIWDCFCSKLDTKLDKKLPTYAGHLLGVDIGGQVVPTEPFRIIDDGEGNVEIKFMNE